MPTMMEPDTDIFEDIFSADGSWVLVKLGITGDHQTYDAIGPFDSEKDAQIFRDTHFPDYTIVELKDPEDAVFDQQVDE